jgi:hypothetical protein
VSRALRAVVWVVGGLGLLGLLSVGMLPAHEVVYDAQPPLLICPRTTECYATYHLEVGNTGSEPQRRVGIRLDAGALDGAVLKPAVAAFGVRRLPVQVTDADGLRTLAFGPMAPRDRAQLRFMLAVPSADRVPDWSVLGLRVEPAEGEARPGSPAALTFGRLVFALLRGVAAFVP